MLFLYSLLLTIAFLAMLPLFIARREKYVSGFKQRLGNYPPFVSDGRPVIWLHAVSVGEVNAAKQLAAVLRKKFPNRRVIISTTTKTGQELAQKSFANVADAVVFFPFDWKFSVQRALRHFRPEVVLLMETEIWPRFIREAKASGAKIAIVNGRLSARSHNRYSKFLPFISRVLADIDLGLMQNEQDASRIVSLGLQREKAQVTGNLKFDLETNESDNAATQLLAARFALSASRPLIIAASTHEPEERLVLDAFCSIAAEGKPRSRLLIVPRHPERFDAVAKMVRSFRDDPACEWKLYTFARRSSEASDDDKNADIILLDSIGELRAVYPLAEIVFVGGSLIPHGGQSVLEPAAVGKAIVTGPHTHNFEAAVSEFLANDGLIQLPILRDEQYADELFDIFDDLLKDPKRRATLGINAARVMRENRGAAVKTVEFLANSVFRT